MEVKMRENGTGVSRGNQYPMGIDLAGGTELIYILNYDQIDRNIENAQDKIVKTRDKLDEAKRQHSDLKPIEDQLRRDQDQLDGLKKSKEEASDKAAGVVRQRIDPNGTKGIPVTTFGNNRDRLRIQLPHASPTEVERIQNAIKTQGRLAFHICSDVESTINAVKEKGKLDEYENKNLEVAGDEYTQFTIKTPKRINKDEFNEEKIVAYRVPVFPHGMEGSHITVASAHPNPQDGKWQIEVQFDAQGSTDFALLTGANVDKRMAIVLDNVCSSAPTIKGEIVGTCQITGSFTKEEAEHLATVLTQGSLPAEVRLDTTFYVGPSLGEEQIQSGFLATAIATVVVILFMLIYYRLSGAVAAFCMMLNLPMLLGAMGFFKATLTLPGIAGIVLTLGMAVDANVLILERIREELARGRPLKLAVSHGFDRAFLTIIDCHMTTLISSIVLYYLGTGPVRGFAVSLSMGILTTLFCNLWLNWILTEWLVNREAVQNFNMMQFFKETHFDFMGNRRLWMTLTGGAAILSACVFVYHTATSKDIFDVDFTGGTLAQFNFAKGKARDDKAVKTDMKDKVTKELSTRVDKLDKALKDADVAAEAVLQKDKDYEASKKDPELAKKLTSKVLHELSVALNDAFRANAVTNVSGDVIAHEALNKKGGLKEVISDLDDQLKLLKQGEELTAQSFGESEKEPADQRGKFRKFTVTTRIVNSLISSELANSLRAVYKEDLEPEAVDMDPKGIAVMRLTTPTLTKEQVNDVLHKSMLKVAEKEPEDVKTDLANLKVTSVTPKDDFLQVEIGGYAAAKTFDKGATAESALKAADDAANDASRLEHVRRALETAELSSDKSFDRIGGPISRINAFGAQVAGETGWMSLAALALANMAVFVYLWFRFEFSGAWGFGAIVALIHDVIIAAGAVIVAHICGMPILINLNIVAALLTITGFSVNDTIVVFDRIREVKAAHPTRSYEEIVNEACNATLSRTILTSLTVVMSVVSLLVFGGPSIKDMAYTLLVGFMVGTYSSIFIAAPLMIWWYKRFGSGRAPVPTQSRPKAEITGAGGAQI